MLTLSDLDQIHKKFWAAQNVRTEKLMADAFVRERAFAAEANELAWLPIRYHTSLEARLEVADKFRRLVLVDQAARGGRSKRPDPLQRHIEAIVCKCPGITGPELEQKLRREAQPGGFIFDVDDGKLFFFDEKGREKTATIGGLKNRLSRAKNRFPKSG